MNSKFKKFNKILMMSVAILLCLVLLSTSVVSGIFAKYVITKTAATTVSLKKFGVTLTVAKGTNVPSGVEVKLDPTSGETVKVTITDLPLVPGQEVKEAVKFTIGANGDNSKPNVSKVNLQVKVTTTGAENFDDAAGKVTGAASGKYYIPIAFKATVGTTTNTIYNPWTVPANDTALQQGVAGGLATKFSTNFTSNSNVATATIYDTANSINSLKFTNLSFGFECWKSDTSVLPQGMSETTADLIQTYLATLSTSKLTVTYEVSLVQG